MKFYPNKHNAITNVIKHYLLYVDFINFDEINKILEKRFNAAIKDFNFYYENSTTKIIIHYVLLPNLVKKYAKMFYIRYVPERKIEIK